jgi:hypothetical protein
MDFNLVAAWAQNIIPILQLSNLLIFVLFILIHKLFFNLN